jgi:hypothetical protein
MNLSQNTKLILFRYLTDAKSEAVDFYQKQGFVLLDSADNHQNQYSLMFLDLLSLKG